MKNKTICFFLCFIGLFAFAQRGGNGGNFTTQQMRELLQKTSIALENTYYSDDQIVESLKNTSMIYDLPSVEFPQLADRLLIVSSQLNKKTTCVIASTDKFKSLDKSNSITDFIQAIVIYRNEGPAEKALIQKLTQEAAAKGYIPVSCVVDKI